jgi:ADP-ribosylglycohydrolase
MTTRRPLTSAQSDRAAGVLLAQACGDALGAPTEFQPAPLPADTPVAMTGGGGFGWEPGEWTDDTQMSIAILDAAEKALADGDTLVDHLDDIAAAWGAWSRSAKDVGNQTRGVLGSRATTAANLTHAATVFHQHNGRSGGNGSLMRTAPVALALLGDRNATAHTARAVSALTHHDPEAGDACVLWCAAIQHAITHGDFNLTGGLDLVPVERRELWAMRIAEAEAQVPTAFPKNGWVVQALQAAWSLITHTPIPDNNPAADSYPAQHLRRVLEGAARLEWDTDTVGAIAGALAGARWGASAVPAEWRRIVHGWPGLTGSDLARRGLALARGGCDDTGWPLADRVDYAGSAAHGRLAQHPHDPGVWLGDIATAENPPEDIDAIVSLCRIGTNQFPGFGKADVVDVWLIDSDKPTSNPNLYYVLADAADAVAAYRAEGKTVLVHCVAAQSRTPTVAAVYGIRHRGVRAATALDEVCNVLPDPLPNPAFERGVGRLTPPLQSKEEQRVNEG